MSGKRWSRSPVLLAVALLALVGAAGFVLLGPRPTPTGSDPAPTASGLLAAAPARSSAASTDPGPIATPYPLPEPRFAFRVTAAVMVDDEVVTETDLEGWLAGRTERWFDIESPGLALPIARVGLFGATTVAQAADGAWSASPRQIYDPWPTIDAAHVVANDALACAPGAAILETDTLAALLAPLSPPEGTRGFLVVDTDAATGCRVTTVATWISDKTTVQWSRELSLTPDGAATPWPAALHAAGLGPAPLEEASSSSAPGASSAGSPGSAATGGSSSGSVSMHGLGEAVFESGSGVGAASRKVTVTANGATWDPGTKILSLTTAVEIARQEAPALLGFIQDNLDYSVAPMSLVVDGEELELPGDGDPCVVQQAHGESVSVQCVLELPLPAGPKDSVRLLIGIGEGSRTRGSGWLTLLSQP